MTIPVHENDSHKMAQLWAEIMNSEYETGTECKESDYVFRRFRRLLRPYAELKYWITQRKLMRLGFIVKSSERLIPDFKRHYAPQNTTYTESRTLADKWNARMENRRVNSLLWLYAMGEDPRSADFEKHAGWYIYNRFWKIIRLYLGLKRRYTQWRLGHLGITTTTWADACRSDTAFDLQSAGDDAK
ncbi:MAG: hypothetical protein WAN89_02865 [Lawsonella sp.]